jgi:hypothetical protein
VGCWSQDPSSTPALSPPSQASLQLLLRKSKTPLAKTELDCSLPPSMTVAGWVLPGRSAIYTQLTPSRAVKSLHRQQLLLAQGSRGAEGPWAHLGRWRMVERSHQSQTASGKITTAKIHPRSEFEQTWKQERNRKSCQRIKCRMAKAQTMEAAVQLWFLRPWKNGCFCAAGCTRPTKPSKAGKLPTTWQDGVRQIQEWLGGKVGPGFPRPA